MESSVRPQWILVTHKSPDLDAIGSVWLFKRFLHGDFGSAPILFVPAGGRIAPEIAAQFGVGESHVIHTDTGLGEFDHHQPERGGKRVCATSLVYDHLCTIQRDKKTDKSLKYLVEYITAIDHFEETKWENPSDLRYQMMLHGLLAGAKSSGVYDDDSMVQFGFSLLDAAYNALRGEFRADEIIQEKGMTMKIGDKRVLAIASSNSEVEKRAQKQDYDLVVRKDEELGHIRVKATPDSGIDLEKVYKVILEHDKVGTWFLHNSHRMLLNGSSKNDTQLPSPLSLTQIVQILKENLE